MPKLARIGTKNNIILEGGGIGVFRDMHETNPAKRYKGIGPGCWDSPQLSDCDCFPTEPPKDRRFVGQTATSADGLRWDKASVRNISWPGRTQKWDTHNNAFWD